MSGDPVEEGGQQMRQGFVQALQTAHTTAALMRGRGTDSRSHTEHLQRVEQADRREQRSIREYNVRVAATIDKSRSEWQLNQARITEIKGRTTHNQEAHTLAQTETRRRIERADSDLARRNKLGDQEHTHNQQIHDKKTTAYDRREARADELHRLDVEYKQLLIGIRKRAAGFTDTLTGQGTDGEAAASTAAFAAADANRDLSEEHERDADAYDQRFAEDTGHNVTEVIDAPSLPAADADAVIDVEFFDIEPDQPGGDDFGVTDPTASTEPEYPGSVAPDAWQRLTEDLTAETRLAHAVDELIDPAPEPDLPMASVVADAVDAAVGGSTGEEPLPEDAPGIDPTTEQFGPEPEWEL
ncbi:hypothetical protein [Nocardia sp. NPDC047038]|uniref:hypothetical protein n=1 Tax=Nocardia sp. NPDC047038 TaxID=3154338 RepID=UPI003408B53D